MELGGIGMGLDGPIPRTERMERLIQRFDELSFASPNMPGRERYQRIAWLCQSCGKGQPSSRFSIGVWSKDLWRWNDGFPLAFRC